MSENAMLLLRKMANEFDKTKRKSFDSDFYIAFSDRIINELESYGYIICRNDVIASIELTSAGYIDILLTVYYCTNRVIQ